MRILATFTPVLIFATAATFDWSGIITLACTIAVAIATILGVHYSTKSQAKKAAQDASRQALDAINTGFNELVQRLQHDNEAKQEQIVAYQKGMSDLQKSNTDLQVRLNACEQNVAHLTQELSGARAEIETLRRTNNDLIVELTKTQAALTNQKLAQ